MKKIHSTGVTSLKPHDPAFCPKQWKLEYLDRKGTGSDAMEKGKYFEFLCIGATADGQPVEPIYVNKGKDLNADYKAITELAKQFKVVAKEMGLAVKQAQVYMETFTKGGTLDILADLNGRECLVDLKYTETKEDERWSEFGWANPENKDLFQAAHYVKLWHETTGNWLPFYYLVFGKSGWVKFIQVIITNEYFEKVYESRINNYLDYVEEMEQSGYPANPEYNKCRKCGVAKFCDSKATAPTVQKVYLTHE